MEEENERTIFSFKELIERAFGNHDVNLVDFKLIETILHLLARKCGLLDRIVQVDLLDSHATTRRNSTLSVVEVTVLAQSPTLSSLEVHMPTEKQSLTEADVLIKYINKALKQA